MLHASRAPQEYPRRVLLAVAGTTPQILTETLYALTQSATPFIPTEVHVMTTSEGAHRIRLQLLDKENGKFLEFCRDYGLTRKITFKPSNVKVLSNGGRERLQDIVSPRDPDCAIHACFAGGRKTMGFYLEYSTDLVFRSDATLSTLYDDISRQAVIAVKAEQVSSFIGKKITPQLTQELGSRLSTRIEGTCIKHCMGSASVTIYDKFKRVLRIETTTNDVSFFKHYRKVEHRDGSITRELAPLKKSIYSIIDLREILFGCNSRYLEFLSSLDDYSDGHRALQQLTKPKTDHGAQVRSSNFFDATEQDLLLAIQWPEFNIHGLRRADLKKFMPSVSSGKLSRYLKRLRIFGLIKRVAKSYRYYPTRIGRAAIAACEKLTAFTITQILATAR